MKSLIKMTFKTLKNTNSKKTIIIDIIQNTEEYEFKKVNYYCRIYKTRIGDILKNKYQKMNYLPKKHKRNP